MKTKMQYLISVIFVLSVVINSALAETRHVPAEHTTIQGAIDACVDGDTVIVAPGTYTGDGNRDIDFKGKAIIVRGSDPNDPDIVAGTIIDCEGTEADPHRGFYFHSEEGADSELAGLTIMNGYGPHEARANGYSAGGGLAILSDPSITLCVVSHNYAQAYGGGVYIGPFSETIVSHCSIRNNSVGSYGGGIYCHPDPKATIFNCVISYNMAMAYGGGINSGANDRSNVLTVAHCTITNNWGKRHSGGIGSSSAVTVRNCIIWDNKSQEGVSEISGLPEVSYCDIKGAFSGIGNIDADPCFVDSVGGDYHLLPSSPCINAGDSQYILNERIVDIDGDDRRIFDRTDMGADEFSEDVPYLFLPCSEFVFETRSGLGGPEPQILSIRNSGTGIMRWTVTEDCGWLNIDNGSGATGGETNEVELSIDKSGLGTGLYECEIGISGQASLNGHEIVRITLHIEDGDDVRKVPAEYSTIQDAIKWALQGDIVLIANGIYQGEGNRDIELQGKAITVQSENGSDSCIIDCQGTEADPHRGFKFLDLEHLGTVLSGLTIMNGYESSGGAIYSFSSSITIRQCVIVGNRADDGGGIYLDGGSQSVLIENCIIAGNQAVIGAGGGIYLSCLWSLSYPKINNCTIVGNRASWSGGGLFAIFGCFITLENSIVWYNSAGRDVSLSMREVPDASNPHCMVSYSNIEGGPDGVRADYYVAWEQGIIDQEPLFADPGYWDTNMTPDDANDDLWVMGDYHLKSQGWRWDKARQEWVTDDVTSFCIDAGNPGMSLGQELITTPGDTNGPWNENIRINMGAYGATVEASLSSVGFSPPVQAWNPKPEDGKIVWSDRVILSWSAIDSVSNDVYFGPTEPGQMQYFGRQIETTFDPGLLEYGKTYYWRVDEIIPTGTVEGDIWHFRVKVMHTR